MKSFYIKLSILASIMKWSHSMLISWIQINPHLVNYKKNEISNNVKLSIFASIMKESHSLLTFWIQINPQLLWKIIFVCFTFWPKPQIFIAVSQIVEQPDEMTSTWPPGQKSTDLSRRGKRTKIERKSPPKIHPLLTSNFQPHLTITYRVKDTCLNQPLKEIVSWIFFLQSCFLKLQKRYVHILHGVWISQKKSHSTLRAKRAMFTFWVDKSWLKMPKMVQFGKILNKCSQTVLPYRSILIC